MSSLEAGAVLPADHPLRADLLREVHARPAPLVRAPLSVSHIAVHTGEATASADRGHVMELAEQAGVPPPPKDARHALMDFGPYRLRWERHTEFSTYTILRVPEHDRPFAAAALSSVPRWFTRGLPGRTLVAMHLELTSGGPSDWPLPRLAGVFGTDRIFGSTVSGGAGRVWTDFQPHGDGFHRLLVSVDPDMSDTRAGRLLQRLLEIETYRMMALLGLPVARGVSPKLTDIETDLAALAATLPTLASVEDERTALDQLTRLAAEAEAIAADTRYRLSASQAYAGLVQQRLDDIREDRIEGLQRLGSFIQQRLTPAIATCQSTARRQDELAERVERASTLLRTRVDVALEGQNQDLLTAMNRRAAAQLRLQETVEGLSVVAISYYLLGLIAYLLKGLEKPFGWLDAAVATALALPLVIAAVYFGTRFVRRRAHGDDPDP